MSSKGKNLFPGMSLNATVPNGLFIEHLLIPIDAVSRNGAGYFVFKVESTPEGATVIPVPIDVLFRRGVLAAVQSFSLAPGDSIVTEGNERLFPMMPVTILTGADE